MATGNWILQLWYHESRRLRRKGKSGWSWHNRALRGEVLSLSILAAFAVTAGPHGIVGFVAVSITGKMLHMAIDYAQHYGLVRVEGAPFASRHAWDCYRPISNALFLNLPRHSEHHQDASAHFYQLDAASEAPNLPYGYATMALIAFVPPLWNRIIDPLLADWDRRLASEDERRLVQERGWVIAS